MQDYQNLTSESSQERRSHSPEQRRHELNDNDYSQTTDSKPPSRPRRPIDRDGDYSPEQQPVIYLESHYIEDDIEDDIEGDRDQLQELKHASSLESGENSNIESSDIRDKVDEKTNTLVEEVNVVSNSSINTTLNHSERSSHDEQANQREKEDAEIEALKATILELQKQEQEIIKSIRDKGTPSEIIKRRIEELHRYNEIKDAAQIILGKCAELDGNTIKKQYEIFGLDPED